VAHETATSQVAFSVLSIKEVALIVADPKLTSVIVPVLSTVATAGFEEDHTNSLFVAFSGNKVTVNFSVFAEVL
jgi:hypothetical protein